MLRIFLFLLFSLNVALSLKICSFNVQSFGETKRKKPEIMDYIVKIISRCDIALVMEIKDKSNTICPFLIKLLHTKTREEYKYVISERLGRNNYKEQYAFLYKPKMVKVKETYQYPDMQPGDEDVFSREPFVVWFSSPKTVVKEFVIIPIHTAPKAAVREIDELYDVYLHMKERWTSENYIFMGDFNAGCKYVRKKHWPEIRLRKLTSFHWLIDDKADTTVKASTDCAYDRIVLHGDKIKKATVPNSANVFDFQKEFGMTEEQAMAVSDHYPVEFQLRMDKHSPPQNHQKHIM